MDGRNVLARITADLVGQPVRKKLPTNVLNLRNTLWSKVRTRVETVAGKETEIRHSARFNPAEKAHRLVSLSRDLDEVVSLLKTEKEAATSKLQRLRGMLSTVPPPAGDSVARSIREMETRHVLRGLPEADRVQLFLRCAETGDATMLHAFLDAPIALLPNETARHGLAIYHEKYTADTWQAHEEASQWAENVASLDEHVGSYVIALQEGQGLGLSK